MRDHLPCAIAALLGTEFGYENTDYCASPAAALPDNVFATAIALGLMAFTGGAMAQTVDQYQLDRIEQTVNRIVARTGKYSGPAQHDPIPGKPPSRAGFTSALTVVEARPV
jgi:hypothetical protein